MGRDDGAGRVADDSCYGATQLGGTTVIPKRFIVEPVGETICR